VTTHWVDTNNLFLPYVRNISCASVRTALPQVRSVAGVIFSCHFFKTIEALPVEKY
jgi:hypothetical protein